jgi:membrane-bound ClpP family serine protease
MGYSDLIWTMWLSVWGNSLLACIAILALFFYLSWKKKLGVADTTLVIMPVVFGITADNYLPTWIRGLFLIPIGILWGMAILRVVGLR